MSEEKQLSVLQRLAASAPPPEDAGAAEARRERVVAALERAISREATAERRRVLRTRSFAALAIAASLALGLGVAWRAHARSHVAQWAPPIPTVAPSVAPPEVRVASALLTRRGGAELVKGERLHGGDVIETDLGGVASLAFPSDSQVALAEGTTRVVIDFLIDVESVTLDRGAVGVGSTGAFRVLAGDVEVTTRGAAKAVVSRTEGRVSVRVTEGSVEVKHDGTTTVVTAPETWPPEPPPIAATTKAPAPRNDRAPHLEKRPDPSTLGEQNALLQSALDARRRGDDAAAIASLDQLLARYPSSPFVQDAHVERMRAYERSGRHADAVAEAGRYLADFPNGYARDEAKALIVK